MSGVLQKPSLLTTNRAQRDARWVAKWPRVGTKVLTKQLTGLAGDGNRTGDAVSVGSSPK